MASSTVYRYFPSRDALLTALIVEGYDDLGGAVEAADASVPLLYGRPVPEYAAPDDTVASATRTTLALLGLVAEAQAAGRTPRSSPKVGRAERSSLAPVRLHRRGRGVGLDGLDRRGGRWTMAQWALTMSARTSATRARRSSREPVLSTTWVAMASRSSRVAWEAIRDSASARDQPRSRSIRSS